MSDAPVSAARWLVLPDRDDVAREAADRFVATATTAIEARGVFRVALSGGTTPNAVFPLLHGEPRVSQVDWGRVEFFWGDERSVPPDDPQSNFGTAYRMLISRLRGVRPGAIHRMQAESEDLDGAALAYETELRLAFGVSGSELPAFDLLWLGLGPDGHTASLFPGSAALRERTRWVVPNWWRAAETWRMTLTYPVINAAREVVFLVTGENKVNAIRHMRSGHSRLPGGTGHRRGRDLAAGCGGGGRRVRRGTRLMTPWLFLVATGIAGAAAYATGWPAWRGYRSRDARDLNAERYLAWRGRAPRGSQPSLREGPTRAERRRLYLAAALAIVALVCLIGFLATS